MNAAIIGNCAYSALLDHGSVEWMCWPRMDSSFVFGPLLDSQRGGEYRVEMLDATSVEQHYVRNTNVLRTVFRNDDAEFELFDFAPRFEEHGRWYKPTMLVRILRLVRGEPMVRVTCRPTYDYGRFVPAAWLGSNHIEFVGLPVPLRLTTDLSLTYIQDSRPFVLTRDAHLVLTFGPPLETQLSETAESFLDRTTRYWQRWVKHTRVPRDYQDAVIRSALVLKLHQYEDTGAIIAATTTSLPEYPGSGRNWDYRFCWLRDTYFSLNAFERIGHFEEMERFLGYLLNLCKRFGDDRLQPLFGVGGEHVLTEQVLEHLDGFRGERPVRIGNQAFEHVQNDVYGEMILAISRLLLDRRFVDIDVQNGARSMVHQLLAQIERRMQEPDAGLWELRQKQQLHSFTLLTHWAGAQRAADIAELLGDPELAARALAAAHTSREILESHCWSERQGALTQAAHAENLDAAMLLAMHFGFFAPDDPRARRHVHAIAKQLRAGNLLKRYDVADDFGMQEAAFTVCSFWLVEALAIIGDRTEAEALFHELLALGNGVGLYSEDILPKTGLQSGNFPQTYSHVGLINAAFRLSRSWD